ncbi:DUF2917 domain-containing protein [Polaromonas sp.]|uniref:DUF2917 domain-containing protein n=1 Tax=Polaromonas sp. TaxID=1869339 RepID=UPI0013B5EC09|nr:DUF2917 domain-containing protein [Polaromonas sp.]NDP62810.1 DUF2917 domain-containing protein [Polaromonas sp.]
MTSFSASHALAGAVQSARFSSQTHACGGIRPAVSYTLPAGQAMTVQARESGVLRVGQGRLWVTFSQAARDLRVPAGDHFLGWGESLRLSAGQTVVMESWPEAAPGAECAQGAATPACVSWQADAPLTLLARLRHALGLAA